MVSGNGKNVLYFNCKIDLRSVTQIRTLIAQLDNVINELSTNAMESIAKVGVAEYELDTGQNKTRVKYKSTDDVVTVMMRYEKMRQFYINKIENQTFGRVTQLVDQSNFRR